MQLPWSSFIWGVHSLHLISLSQFGLAFWRPDSISCLNLTGKHPAQRTRGVRDSARWKKSRKFWANRRRAMLETSGRQWKRLTLSVGVGTVHHYMRLGSGRCGALWHKCTDSFFLQERKHLAWIKMYMYFPKIQFLFYDSNIKGMNEWILISKLPG